MGKMAPRWSQEGFKVEKINSFPPCWGPSWYPIFNILSTRVVHKRLEDPVGLHVVSRHQFLGESGSPRTPLRLQKYRKSVILSSEINVFGLPVKVALGKGRWEFFGRFLDPS